jgi:hypothetical protein
MTFSISDLILTLSITTLSKMTFIIRDLNLTLSIMTFSIRNLILTLSIKDTQHDDIQRIRDLILTLCIKGIRIMALSMSISVIVLSGAFSY